MPALKYLLIAGLVALTSGCASLSAGCRSGPNLCRAEGPPNGEVDDGTSCAFVVLNKHVCTYDAEGRLKAREIRTGAGACFCLGA